MRTYFLSIVFIGCSALLAASCGDDNKGGAGDAAADAAGPIDGALLCTSDKDCDDGIYCNGAETCRNSRCYWGVEVICDDKVKCTTDICDESRKECVYNPPDQDGDGHYDAECVDKDSTALGDDCDDKDADRYPGNLEVCDGQNHDEDCDPSTHGGRDQDGDGFEDALCCNTDDSGNLDCGDDCNDFNPAVNPHAVEICDGYDNDCDGQVDEDPGLAKAMYRDRDGDGDGDKKAAKEMVCPGTGGYSSTHTDCNEDDPTINGKQVEICDGKDNDCDGKTDESPQTVPWYLDKDGDGFGDPNSTPVMSCKPIKGRSILDTDCNDNKAAINPAANEICDGLDNDCNGKADFNIGVNDFEDDDGDGVADANPKCGGKDCNDLDPSTAEGFEEICDHKDNDCDGEIDEGVTQTVWYPDRDRDGWGDNSRGMALAACEPITGYVARPGDCNDNDPEVNPGAVEQPDDNIDNDCDGYIDETECGNGAVEPGEECDNGPANSDTKADACRKDCKKHWCGDGVKDGDEACDDGNRVDTDKCRNNCTPADWVAICGANPGALDSFVSGAEDEGMNYISVDFRPGDRDTAVLPAKCYRDEKAPDPGLPDHVYTWSAPCFMWYRISTESYYALDTVLGVVSEPAEVGECVAAKPVACNDDVDAECTSSAVNIKAAQDKQHEIVVESRGIGYYSMNIWPLPCCNVNNPTTKDCLTVTGSKSEVDNICEMDSSCCKEWDADCVKLYGTYENVCPGVACESGYADCDKYPETGCEVNLKTDASHCGDCDTNCLAGQGYTVDTATCNNGTCELSCYSGWGDCDHAPADGCETSLDQTANCGSCGNDCAAADLHVLYPLCSYINTAYKCTNDGCESPYGDCDSNFGCETSLTTVTNCGYCGYDCNANHTVGAFCNDSDGYFCDYTSAGCASGWCDCNADLYYDGCESPNQGDSCGTTSCPPT